MVGSNSGTNMRGQIASVDGGSLVTDGMGAVSARVQFPPPARVQFPPPDGVSFQEQGCESAITSERP